MANNLYVTAAEERSGKSAIILGVMQMIIKEISRVAIFRPIINDHVFGRVDHDLNLVLKYFKLDIEYEETHAYTLSQARQLITSGQEEILYENILKKYKQLEAKYDFVLCEGTDFRGKDPGFEFDLNANIAANLGAPVLIIASGRDKTTEEICSHTAITIDTLEEQGLDLAGCIINRAPETFLRDTASNAKCREQFGRNFPLYVIPENKALGNPTIDDVKRWLGAEVLYGKPSMLNLVNNYLVAAMQISNFLEYLKEGSLIITPGDRSDIIISSLASRISSAYPNISGILVTGGIEVSSSVQRLIQGWTGIPVPVLFVESHTYDTVQSVNELYGRIEPTDTKRIATALGWFAKYVNVADLSKRVVSQRSTKITPRMFEYSLVETAAANRQRIVLPEGTGERILSATDIVLRRGIADITLLGKEEEIRTKANALNLNIEGVEILEPCSAECYDDFVQTYFDLRKHKGIVMDVARDRMCDPTYFGTMMVHKGLAGGMVSGSITTTAQTIRPAFEFIKTKPGVSVVSSIFIMCLQSKILAFGDCAVVPNPDARQLAEIALSSAETAQIFGINPKVALLSYSTGGSGSGQDVDKVVQATAIAKELMAERGLNFPLEGPLQYDAAFDPSVAQLKMPNSDVAGQATVFVFPDLNTGNNTYKAVQRAANAVAMGPVLQGLNKPVNDLSRGCTVADIVDTVALTAIQAQTIA
ncbi:phosphate acetyltransferase [Desulfobulbus rhabdoformis]|jgi:phosphate acetyltransferase|uniref:phosphate acetyltransferase n=1 Tax=Desulfobulbus rhabdoformis TaxID=34032 RepID=UPI001966378E|nr:phosphate acetyltransferase [Desulfobulbus rhabdoformis]MBM9613003.1 phosphate acetyltransferase [Desulfobulbus rhabdoformis]